MSERTPSQLPLLRRIARAKAAVVRQQRLVAELAMMGADNAAALKLLTALQQSFQELINERDRDDGASE